MLKKRKHKMKRRNTEPQMILPLTTTTGSNHQGPPMSAPPGNMDGQHNQGGRPPNLADLCDSPSHATAV